MLDEIPSQDVIDFLFAQCSTHRTNAEDDDDNDEGSAIDENAIKTYLNFVSEFPTVFDQEAFTMLKCYFIATRAIRPSNLFFDYVVFLPFHLILLVILVLDILTPKSFDILQRLSECHAKLCLRSDVSM